MNITRHVLYTCVIQELTPVICIKTLTNIIPDLPLKITFYMDHSSSHWEDLPNGKIVYEKIINTQTNETIKFSDLSTIAQIYCNKHCREYLSDNNLDPYNNIIPINSYPYRMPDPENMDLNKMADIIPFIQPC
ncbi:TPA: hypothetical protein I8672_003370 [Legionella pneumophila]|nr:hypothetical protein [Legionella pneumophila]HBD7284168.1 hypothetical protein [Legionella pneumophila]HEN8242157.1 hypothetical protein [Legionella pneumophila]